MWFVFGIKSSFYKSRYAAEILVKEFGRDKF